MSEPRTSTTTADRPTQEDRGLPPGAAISGADRGLAVATSDTAPERGGDAPAVDLGVERRAPKRPRLVIDTSAAPELAYLADLIRGSYVKRFDALTAFLKVPRAALPTEIFVKLVPGLANIAETTGRKVSLQAEWFRDHPDDMGAFIHELVHVVQAYPKQDPDWLCEGIADYARANVANDDPSLWSLPKLTKNDRYDAS